MLSARSAGNVTYRVLLILAIVLASLVSITTPRRAVAAPDSQPPTPITSGVPRFEPGACVFELAEGQAEGRTVSCGTAIVPERHDRPSGKTIRLPVAVYKARNANPAPEPILLLSGGPGSSAQVFSTLMPADSTFYLQLTQDRDVVVFEQRGVGKADPALTCPEATESAKTDAHLLLALSLEETLTEKLIRCGQRLAQSGIDLAAYTTTESAADVDAVRRVLGYQQVHLLGGSYGSELAVAVARDFPASVRTVNLTSVAPLQTPWFFEQPLNFDRALRELFRACALDPACRASHPNLERDYQQGVAQLNSVPLPVPVIDSQSGQFDVVNVDGNLYTIILFQLFYVTDLIPIIPDLLGQVASGDPTLLSLLGLLVFSSAGEGLALGAHFSMICSRDASQALFERTRAKYSGIYPEVRAALEPQAMEYAQVCAQWPSRGSDPKANKAVVSDIPTTLISGQFDPVTPPSYADIAAQTLSRAYKATIPGGGHTPITSPTSIGTCGLGIMLQLMNRPDSPPDMACAGQPATPPAPSCDDGRFFTETQKCVRQPFLGYWDAHGGLAINGFPISDEFTETLEDGRSYKVQYFERVRMEHHPENAPPYDVLLGQFGRRIHGGADPGVAPQAGARFFPETGHNVEGGFLAYWEANGGLPQFGFPITEVITETLEDGKQYKVQYFERARFEYHQENQPPYDVLLGQFGRRILGSR